VNVSILSLAEMYDLKTRSPEALEDTYIISICDSSWKDRPFVHQTEWILPLQFDDIVPAYLDNYTIAEKAKFTLFNENHAQKIIDFIKTMDMSKSVIVHCFAGISRSAAVACFIEFHENGLHDMKELFSKFDICPNLYVFGTLCKQAGYTQEQMTPAIQFIYSKRNDRLDRMKQFKMNSKLILPTKYNK
jgi:predicted protein tyrosine phosphatase